MSSSLVQSSSQAMVNSVGALGSVAITGTSAVVAPTGFYFFCLNFTQDSVVGARVDLAGATNANLTLFTTGFTGGFPVYGKWTSITLTSGSAIGYLARL
jgi:hypothetical protein